MRTEEQLKVMAEFRAVLAETWTEGFDAAVELMTGPDWAPSPANPYEVAK